jgi:hypothetical protein
MIYAIPDKDGCWTIMKGWEGCQPGQGEVLERYVPEDIVRKKMIEHENLDTNPFGLGK